jgi:glucan phosphoethanolaminetransferase (alkaline phosphatase superfamily)
MAAISTERTWTWRAYRARVRARRKAKAALVTLAPCLWFLGTDVMRRADQLASTPRPFTYYYAGSVAVSAAFWAVLVYSAGRRRGVAAHASAVLFIVLFGLSAGIEAAFHSVWNVYLSVDGQIHSKSIPWSVLGTLPFGRPQVVGHLALAFGVAIGITLLARRFVRPGRFARVVAPSLVPLALLGVTQLPTSYRTYQATSADMLYFHGLVGLAKEHLGITNESPELRVQRRTPMPVPPLAARPARSRNVVLILQESQRADVTCVEYDPDCPLATPWSNAAAPGRMPLLQMRANASTTAISISNIWSGVEPTESRALLHSVPLLWDYAAAAGYDTAYWTSQNLMFGNARLYIQDLNVSRQCVATDLDPRADLDTGAYDSLLTERVRSEWASLREPFFAVVHYSNPHYPYVYDPAHAPFQPASMDKAADKNDEFFNFYKDVVYLSDLAVGELIRFIRTSEAGNRTVLIYTADHGEAFREHWQLGHTSSIYDEEVLVPTWIDAPPETLSPEEAQNIAAARDDYVWHLDLAPTILDLLGVWDAPGLAPFRARMIGHPITRVERTVAPVVMTNCTWVWECAFRNWGMMQGPTKLEAREWDSEFHCFDVRQDPAEQSNLGERYCAPLADVARARFHVMPVEKPPPRLDEPGVDSR